MNPKHILYFFAFEQWGQDFKPIKQRSEHSMGDNAKMMKGSNQTTNTGCRSIIIIIIIIIIITIIIDHIKSYIDHCE